MDERLRRKWFRGLEEGRSALEDPLDKVWARLEKRRVRPWTWSALAAAVLLVLVGGMALTHRENPWEPVLDALWAEPQGEDPLAAWNLEVGNLEPGGDDQGI